MKRLAFIFALLPILAVAQTITEGQSAIIYSLPKTEFVIEVTVEKLNEKPGKFYQYSDRFLATSDVITSDKTYYKLSEIRITPRTVPDPKRTYTIIPSKKSLATRLTVNDEGILCGINVEPAKKMIEQRIERVQDKIYTGENLLPLNEEYMLAGSVAKMAEGAAKQIYRIRENRVDLLSGDIDNMPQDGASLKALLGEMEAQEKELTKLFVGEKTSETLTQKVVYSPSKAVEDEVIFRFSAIKGVVSKDDLSGVPYYVNIRFEPVETVQGEVKKKKTEKVFSLLPVMAQVKLDDGENVLYEQEIILPQLGETLPIPLETMDKFSKAYVSPETGRLLSIEQLPKK